MCVIGSCVVIRGVHVHGMVRVLSVLAAPRWSTGARRGRRRKEWHIVAHRGRRGVRTERVGIACSPDRTVSVL